MARGALDFFEFHGHRAQRSWTVDTRISRGTLAITRFRSTTLRNHIFWDDTGMGWGYFNNGLGAARIRGFKLLVDGKPQPKDDLRNIIAKALGLQIIGLKVSGLNMRVGSWMKPDSGEKLFWLLPGSATATDKLYSTWTRISFETCYCSMYDECWTLV